MYNVYNMGIICIIPSIHFDCQVSNIQKKRSQLYRYAGKCIVSDR